MAWRLEDAKTKLEAIMFRELDDAGEEVFRGYARTVLPDPGHWTVYHPVCRDEWTKRGQAPKENR